jgi:hypothetical protein
MTDDELSEMSNEELSIELAERADSLRRAAREVEHALLNQRAALTDEMTGNLWDRCDDVEELCRGPLASRTVERAVEELD